MFKYWHLALPVALSVGALSGCGTTPEGKPAASAGASAANSPEAAVDKRREVEAVKADCMKKKGFTYVAFVPKPKLDVVAKAELGDYAAMKEYRSKYGFDVFSHWVYREKHPKNPEQLNDPNDALKRSLSRSQYGTYGEASDECEAQAINVVFGKSFRSAEEFHEEGEKASERLNRELNADPQLVELAQGYADCLKGKGYRVTDVKPSGVADALWLAFNEEGSALGKANQEASESGDLAAAIPTPEQARPYLTREIKAALEDLECGKEFRPVFIPKKDQLEAVHMPDMGLS
ncbi:hypothetical protein [Rhizohabitans arisaemae]|uniref:hypothetical protein n=1 Tax=Rhizohabitans arisaemae TaxID=2720610 RepID=UPI0024B1EB9E|nr:hypothetical protein [Rhizohabitans arisaemae]